MKKIVRTIKDLVSRSLTSQGVKVLVVIAGTSYIFWDVLVLIIDAVALTQHTLTVVPEVSPS